MTGKIVNLRTVRKRKTRDADRRAADANAAKHGQSAAQRDLGEARRDRDDRRLDGHLRDGASDDGEGSAS